MNLKKSMISVAAASLLAVGFAGCDTGSSTTASATNQASHITNPKGTVTGLVQDTNGNPMEGVKVYLAGQTTTTDAGGVYTFNDVPVSTTAGADVANVSQLLSVTIAAPEGYLGATVTVTPSAQVDAANSAGGQVSTASIFIDGYLAQAGTAVLPELGGTVTGVLRNNTTGEALANTKINLDLVTAGTVAVGQTNAQNVVNTSYATETYSVTTDANGKFTFASLPIDSTMSYSVPGYVNVSASPFNTNAEDELDAGNLFVNPVVANDTIAPYIITNKIDSEVTPYVGVAHPTDAGEGMDIYAEGIDGTAGHEFLIALTEAIDTTKVNADSLIVFDRTNSKELNATLTVLADNKTLSIQTDVAVPQATILEFRLRRSDFTDIAGNVVNTIGGVFNPNAGVTSSAGAVTELQGALSGNQYAVVNASTYTVPAMGLVPPVVPTGAQDNGVNADLTANGYSNSAFNTISQYNKGTSTILNNMNAANAVNADLVALASAIDPTLTTVNQNAATITFDVDANVKSYYARVIDNNNAVIATATITQVAGADIGAGAAIVPTVPTVPTNALVAAGTELKNGTDIVSPFLVDLGRPLATGDKVEIYAVNDFGDSSLATTIPLVDNTPITTVINTVTNGNVALPAGNPTGAANVDIVGAGAPSGATGNLLDQGTSGAGGGLPFLYVRADMLEESNGAADNNLQNELTGADNIYDSADITAMSKARSIGMQVSEPVVDFTNLANSLKVYDAANTVVNNVTATSAGANGASQDVAFTVSNILDMQNYAKVSLEGLTDAAGNVADASAADKLYDAMPPLMTDASVSGDSATFTFSENVSLVQTGAGIANYLNMAGGTSVYIFNTDVNGNFKVRRNTNYTDHNGHTVLANTALTTNSSNVNGVVTVTLTDNAATAGVPAGTDFGNFFENVHGIKNRAGVDNAIATGSSVVGFTNVPDTHTSAAGVAGTNNSWANAADHITVVPSFAAVDTIAPKLAARAGAINPLAATADQVQAHIVGVGVAGGLMNVSSAGSAADNDWVPGDAVPDSYTIELQFREPITAVAGSFADAFGTIDYDMTVATAGNTYKIITPKTITVVGFNTLQVVFSKDATTTGNVEAGDALHVTGVKDASGNTTDVVVTLGTADSGVTVNASSYK